MTETDILQALTDVFRNEFDQDDLVLTQETTAHDIEGWDSQAHVSLIVAAEVRFGVRFTTTEVETMRNVGSFVALIQKKLGGQ